MLHLLVAFSTVVDLVVGWIALRRFGADGVTFKGLRWALVASAFAMAVKLPLHRIGGLNTWGHMLMIYTWCVIALPGVGAMALLASKRGLLGELTRPARWSAWLLVACAWIGVQASWIEPHWLVLEQATVELPAARTGTTPIRVGVLADIQTDHVGAHEHEAVDLLLAEKPDLILLPGDLFQADWRDHPGEWEKFRELLMRLDAPAGAFVVVGDVDTPHELRRLTEGTPVQLLLDQAVRLDVGDRKVELLGLYSARLARQPHVALQQFEEEPGEDAVRIAFAHHPDVSLHLSGEGRIDLVVAGHTHGGQVVVPFFGPPMTLSRIPRHMAAGGLHELGGSPLYVSRGVGMERTQAPRIRLFCRPEVSLIELR